MARATQAPDAGGDLPGAAASRDTGARRGGRRWRPDDPDRLIAELRARGIAFLSGGRDPALEAFVARAPLAPAELLEQLAASTEPRLRDASIALLLLHPELAGAIADWAEADPGAGAEPPSAAHEQVVVLALAATYLQRQWRTRLDLALGARPWLQGGAWRKRGLPAPWVHHGEWGLRALANRERSRRHVPFDFVSAWQDQVDHLAAQTWMERRSRAEPSVSSVATRRAVASSGAAAPPGFAPSGAAQVRSGFRGMPHAPRGASAMSLRQPVDREAIERFLRRLGGEVRQPGRVYLVGGTTMVYEGYRARTLDIDVLIEADDPGPLLAAVRALKDALDVNVELASPGDFIPLPAGWRERSIWIGRFGPLDAFHFDLYSVALSKIERGTERDFEDVLALLRDGRLEMERLDAAYAEVLPRIATEGLAALDPDRFAAHYQALRDRLGA